MIISTIDILETWTRSLFDGIISMPVTCRLDCFPLWFTAISVALASWRIFSLPSKREWIWCLNPLHWWWEEFLVDKFLPIIFKDQIEVWMKPMLCFHFLMNSSSESKELSSMIPSSSDWLERLVTAGGAWGWVVAQGQAVAVVEMEGWGWTICATFSTGNPSDWILIWLKRLVYCWLPCTFAHELIWRSLQCWGREFRVWRKRQRCGKWWATVVKNLPLRDFFEQFFWSFAPQKTPESAKKRCFVPAWSLILWQWSVMCDVMASFSFLN